MRSSCDRRGSTVVLVAAFGTVTLMGVMGLAVLTRGNVGATARIVREVCAREVAAGVAAQVQARANRAPWSRRFWQTGRDLPPRAHYRRVATRPGGGSVTLEGEGYTAAVQDADPERRTWRLTIDVTQDGEHFAYGFEGQVVESVLDGLSRFDPTLGRTLAAGSSAAEHAGLLDKDCTVASEPRPGTLSSSNRSLYGKGVFDLEASRGVSLRQIGIHAGPTWPPPGM